MFEKLRMIGLAIMLIASAPVFSSSIQSLQQQALEQSLAEHRQWQALLHMEPQRFGGVKSYVDDPVFFLDKQGASDAQAELFATVAAFYQQPDSQCRYPARRLFLIEQLQATFPAVPCSEYQAWRETINTDSVILVFASSYLNSPSSMYGHTFLRFDPPNVDQGSPLLSYALNFGASTNESDNGFLYAFRGLAGGYPGLFAANPYYEKVKEYSRLENRDLWEYRLNLKAHEIDRMMAHVWELDKINFDYYFFDENCSFRLLELLDVARPGSNLSAQFPVVAIPVDTAKAVADAGMIEKVYYRPSNQSKLQKRLETLNKSEQLMALSLAQEASEQPADFDALDEASQRDVVTVAYSYLRYLNETKERDEQVAGNSFRLLKQLASYPKLSHSESLVERPDDPMVGHGSGLLAVSGGYRDDLWYGDLEWRIAYHDLLDPIEGYPTDTSLNMGRLVVRAEEGESMQLQRFDILEINSLYPRNRFFKPLAWQVNTGLDRQRTNGKDELVPQVNAGVGVSFHAPFQGRVFTLLRTRAEYNSGFAHNWDLAGGGLVGYLRQQPYGNTLLQAEQLYFVGGVERTAVELGQSVTLGSNASLRLSVKRTIHDSEGTNEASLAYRYYY